MRIVPLHPIGSPTLGNSQKINPHTSLVSLIAEIGADGGSTVNASLSIMGEVEGFAPEPILFGGTSIISFSGTTTAQWTGQVENNGYSSIFHNLITCSAISFKSAATEEDR